MKTKNTFAFLTPGDDAMKQINNSHEKGFSSLLQQVGLCLALSWVVMMILTPEAWAIAGDLKDEVTAMDANLKSFGRLGMVGSSLVAAGYCIWKQNAMGVGIAAICAIGSDQIIKWVGKSFALTF